MNAIRHSSPAKVSTIIAAYNAEQTIAQTIESALAQNFDGHEIVVVNDGSTDSTAAILEQYGNRIRAVTQANRGAAAARNTGVVHSTGKYVAILDSDDLWLPGKLKTMVGALERNPHATLAFSEYTKIDEHGTEFEVSSVGHAPCDGRNDEELSSDSYQYVGDSPGKVKPLRRFGREVRSARL